MLLVSQEKKRDPLIGKRLGVRKSRGLGMLQFADLKMMSFKDSVHN